jgi:hypothetical protein
MSLKDFIKKNKLFSVITIAFLVWVGFLIVLSLTAVREVTFMEVLGKNEGTDVSTQYSSVLSFFRYLLEPFAAISYIFVEGYEVVIAILIIIFLYRIVFLISKKRGLIKNEKAKLLWYPIKDMIRTSFLLLTPLILIGVAIIAILYFTTGMYYVNLHFMNLIQFILIFSFIILAIKATVIAAKWFHPQLKLNYSKKKRYKVLERQSRGAKLSRATRREFSYLFGVSLFILGSALLLMSTQFPGHTIVPKTDLEEGELLLDFHVHTTFSDGWITPEERVLWYMDHGISGAAFSDHDNLRGARAAKEFVEKNNLNFLVFAAEEWTDHERETGLHMNIYGLDEELVPFESYVPGGPKAMNASDTIQYVKSQGGFVTVNHYNYRKNPNGGRGTPYNVTDFVKWGVDGFEITNGGGWGGKYRDIRKFCLNETGELTRKIACIAGSDTHTNQEINTFIRVKVDPNNLTLANIFATLKNNTHDVIAIDLYPRVFEFPDSLNWLEDIGFGIIESSVNYFSNIDSFQVLSWIIWSCIGYLLLAFLYRQTKKLDLEKVKRKILV